MLHLNTFQLDYPNASFCSYGNTDFIPDHPDHGFSQASKEESVVFNDSNCLGYENGGVQDWFKNCQVLGFIPDRPSSGFSGTDFCNYSMDYRNQIYARSSSAPWSNPPKKTTLRANLKRKRKRTVFTTEQIVILESVFQRKPYVSREERLALMNKLQISEKAIKIWFQNRRRMSDKKCQGYKSDSPSLDDTQDYLERLTFIESQIKDSTDENGYVTLNNHVMTELVNVIDDYLSKDVNLSDLEFSTTTSSGVLYSSMSEDVVMYEPISPASSD